MDRLGRPTSRYCVRRGAICISLAVIATFLGPGVAVAIPTATVTGTFGDSCRDFAALSSKDISHVELHYSDASVVKDESVASPNYSIDGDAGDEIDFAVVKSGTTRQQFDCQSNSPPEAILELQINPNCAVVREDPPLMHCPSASGRTEWTSYSGPIVHLLGDLCVSDPSLCQFTLRGTSSFDPDNNITTWSVDFGDGSSTGGSWISNPPVNLVLTLPGCNQFTDVILTVTDAAGNSDSDTMRVATGNCPD